MKESTINFALRVLDSQFNNVLSCRSDEQRAYYDGMKVMFNMLVSDGYETNAHVKYFDNGIHYLINE